MVLDIILDRGHILVQLLLGSCRMLVNTRVHFSVLIKHVVTGVCSKGLREKEPVPVPA